MKKIFATFAVVFACSLLLVGCSGNSSVDQNISEITTIYFKGQDVNGQASGSISVGEREEPYKADGTHRKNVDFSLINIDFGQKISDEELNVKIIVNSVESDLTLYFNPLSSSYMADLGYKLNDNDIVKVTFDQYEINFENISQDFATSYQRALEIAKESLKSEIDNMSTSGDFKGECYLKILSSNSNFNDLFWAFTIVGQEGENYNVVISVDNENIIYKD